MFAFKFKAIDRQNHTIVDRVEASSIEDAYDRLAKLGFSDIRVIDSKKTAIDLNDVASRRRLVSSARQELELQKQSSLIIKFMMLYARDVKIWGGLLVWLVVSVSLYGLHSAIVFVVVGLLLVHILWFIWAMVPMVLYDLALDASFWRRWGELERIMRFLATWKSWFKTPISEREIIFRLASAEAGQGRLEAALKRSAVLKNDRTLAPGFYEARLASVYFAAGNIQLVVETQKTALQLNSGIANTVDLAITLVRWQDDPKGAAILMAGIEGAKLSDLQRIIVYYCNGVISLKTQQPEKALELLTQALEMSKAFGVPLLQVFVIEIHAHLALALCACNRHQDAIPHFSASRPLLEAWKDIALLRQCDLAQSQRS